MTKRDLLEHVNALTWATPQSIAQAAGCSRESASMALLRANRAGLLRRIDQGDRATYCLSPRGGARLVYFLQQAGQAAELV